jgi:NAD(P)-dependent dehydrogenase (short-subunit alcohol dehydrogenase family)
VRRPDAAASSLDGKVVVITGAARGLGAALATRLAARGARLALVGLEPEQLAAVAREAGPDAAAWRVNVTDSDALARVAASVVERFGRVDAVVANAGIAAGGTLLVSDPRSYERVIEVNLLGSIRTARAFLPSLIDSRGYLLQISSAAALAPTPGLSAYGASKSGVEAFAHALAAEVVGHGVDVGVAYLSWTDTDMVRGAAATGGFDALRSRLPYPLNRVYPLGPAADRIVAGIERRAPHVYGQGWLRASVALRPVAPRLLMFGLRRAKVDIAATEAAMRRGDAAGLRPVGPGGAADTADTAGTAGTAVPVDAAADGGPAAQARGR